MDRRPEPLRTKIVATVGPASSAPAILRALVRAGVDVFRINFSHGDHAAHALAIRRIRAAERAEGKFVAILGDLQGPRIRVGRLPDGGLTLANGASVKLVPARGSQAPGRPGEIPVSYGSLARDVKSEDRILVADGQIELRVRRRAGSAVEAEVVRGGVLLSRKGINLPDSPVSLGTLTPKDRADLAFAAEKKLDFVGVSFARSARDVVLTRRLLRRAGGRAEVIAKIERREALLDLGALLDASDGVMVARGDLAVEAGYERVPALQKRIIREANLRGVPVITATQMLESMVRESSPTRAEASDVANAILDGTDAVMLSAETSIGQYPVGAVKAMARIAEGTEATLDEFRFHPPMKVRDDVKSCALARAAVRAAAEVDARCIVAFTLSGRMARLLARERGLTPVLACARDPATLRRLGLVWGVRAVALESSRTVTDMARLAREAAAASRLARVGDTFVALAGSHDVPGGAYALRIDHVTARDARSRAGLARTL